MASGHQCSKRFNVLARATLRSPPEESQAFATGLAIVVTEHDVIRLGAVALHQLERSAGNVRCELGEVIGCGLVAGDNHQPCAICGVLARPKINPDGSGYG